MLRLIKLRIPKTQIMNRANLSYTRWKEYIALLEDNRLILFDAKSETYAVTKRGLQFMDAYSQLSELVPNAGERNEVKGRT